MHQGPTGSIEQRVPVYPTYPLSSTTCNSHEVMSDGDSEPYVCQALN